MGKSFVIVHSAFGYDMFIMKRELCLDDFHARELITLDKVEIEEQMPFMLDLLEDSGGTAENIPLAKDIQTARSFLAGEQIAQVDAKSLREFLDCVQGL